METWNEQLFSPEFILDYLADDNGRKRFLTYVTFRFFSFAAEEHPELPAVLKEKLNCTYTKEDFSVIEDFLAQDYYFSPVLQAGTADTVLLFDAIRLAELTEENTALLDNLLVSYAPVAAAIAYTSPELELTHLLENGTDFYAALCIAVSHFQPTDDVLAALLPKFTAACRKEYRFSCGDFILFDFMDEYFEQKNCRNHPAFIELTDALVAGTLNYFNTDFGTMLENELFDCCNGSSSRFAGVIRSGSLQLSPFTPAEKEKACHLLAELFHYAAIYELRSNLFDFHLDEDKIITLANWKENLRWHYVQYSNVYEMTISSFYTAMLSRHILKQDFYAAIAEW